MLKRERNCIVAAVFLAMKGNNNGKDTRKKTMKKKRRGKKTSASSVGISSEQEFI